LGGPSGYLNSVHAEVIGRDEEVARISRFLDLEEAEPAALIWRPSARPSAWPIMADETCWQPADVVDVAKTRAADALSIYVAKSGGLARASRVAVLAEAYGLPCDVNGSLESGIGNAASLHLATAMPAISLPSVIPVTAPAGTGSARTAGRYYADDLVTEPFAFEEGSLLAPDGPGLGVELDEEKLTRYRVDGR
jgi:L-alanine-DL-glutamate epimerase-like enolase superfamily enzyme